MLARVPGDPTSQSRGKRGELLACNEELFFVAPPI